MLSFMLFDQIQKPPPSSAASGPRRSVGIILAPALGALARHRGRRHVSLRGLAALPAIDRAIARGPAVCGTLGGKSVMAMEGRFHFYEGYSFSRSRCPCVMKALGCDT